MSSSIFPSNIDFIPKFSYSCDFWGKDLWLFAVQPQTLLFWGYDSMQLVAADICLRFYPRTRNVFFTESSTGLNPQWRTGTLCCMCTFKRTNIQSTWEEINLTSTAQWNWVIQTHTEPNTWVWKSCFQTTTQKHGRGLKQLWATATCDDGGFFTARLAS